MKIFHGKTISRDITIGLSSIVVMIIFLYGSITYVTLTQKTEDELHQKCIDITEQLARIVSYPVWNGANEIVNEVTSSYMPFEKIASLVVKNKQGDVITQKINLKYIDESRPMVDTVPIAYGKEKIGYVIVTMSREDLRITKTRHIFTTLFIIIVLIITIIIGSLIIIKKNLYNPLSDLRNGIAAITDGDYTHKLDEIEYQDINDIIQDVNKMIEQIAERDQTLVTEIKMRKKAELEVKTINENLEQRVIERTAQLEAVQSELVEKAHKAGMAEIASDTLHNVGNILNSIQVSAQIVDDIISTSSIKRLQKANELLRKNKHNIEKFILEDPKGKQLLEYFLQLETLFISENENISSNTHRLLTKVEAIADVIRTQQNYAGASLIEKYNLAEIVEDALIMQSESLNKYNIQVSKKFDDGPILLIQKAKVIHILINLIKNAREAMLSIDVNKRELIIAIESTNEESTIIIQDTGEGIAKENMSLIFSHGFTTKPGGHGFGLHSCANYMNEMNGKIWLESNGPGTGTTFFLKFQHTPSTEKEKELEVSPS